MISPAVFGNFRKFPITNMADVKLEKQNKPEKTVTVAKNAAELQKIRLEKLMSNPVSSVTTSYEFQIGFYAASIIVICFRDIVTARLTPPPKAIFLFLLIRDEFRSY